MLCVPVCHVLLVVVVTIKPCQLKCATTILLLLIDPFCAVFWKDCSPGPGYYVKSSITRFGTDGTPMYSILGRAKDPSKSISIIHSTVLK